MARKKVREYDAKRLLRIHLARLAGLNLPLQVAQVTEKTSFLVLLEQQPWLRSTKLVVKPDMLFGQRGKHDLVGLNLSSSEAEQFINHRMNKTVVVNNRVGDVNTFLIEPFVPHKEEFYLAIQSTRLGVEILFSECGGVHVEENWERIRKVFVPTLAPVTTDTVAELVSDLDLELRSRVGEFIAACFAFYTDLDCTLLEMNPFTVDASGNALPLDVRLELDDTAKYRSSSKWGDLEFPLPFGRSLTSAEMYVSQLDEQTGASLKLTILNPKGRVWLMVAGGGASVIYADTVGDLGVAEELGNYGEYSGGPNAQETYQYAKTVIDCAVADSDGKGRALIIGGAIANFTDVAATFSGIIKALQERVEELRACGMRIYVRRAGPNYKAGLQAMKDFGARNNLPIEVHGPEASMTGVVKQAISYVQSFA